MEREAPGLAGAVVQLWSNHLLCQGIGFRPRHCVNKCIKKQTPHMNSALVSVVVILLW